MLSLCISFLAVAGVVLCLWCLAGCFLLPFGGKDLQLTLRVCDHASKLERQLRAYSWLRGSGLLQAELTVLDCGLDEEGRTLVRLLQEIYDFTF